MSYDISLYINTGIEERKVVEVGNYTYNCCGMFTDASAGTAISDLDGEECWKIEPMLASAVENLQKNPNKYRAMNPENGWGDYDSFLLYVEKLLRECRQNPKCKIVVC